MAKPAFDNAGRRTAAGAAPRAGHRRVAAAVSRVADRDLGQIIGFLLTVWIFITPICYPETQMPHAAMAILSKNPIYSLVRFHRAVFLEGQGPAIHTLVKFRALSLVVFFAGYVWFYKSAQVYCIV